MDLYKKIITIYPNLTSKDFMDNGSIHLRNDGNGDYIYSWDNETYTSPTEEQLAAISQ